MADILHDPLNPKPPGVGTTDWLELLTAEAETMLTDKEANPGNIPEEARRHIGFKLASLFGSPHIEDAPGAWRPGTRLLAIPEVASMVKDILPTLRPAEKTRAANTVTGWLSEYARVTMQRTTDSFTENVKAGRGPVIGPLVVGGTGGHTLHNSVTLELTFDNGIPQLKAVLTDDVRKLLDTKLQSLETGGRVDKNRKELNNRLAALNEGLSGDFNTITRALWNFRGGDDKQFVQDYLRNLGGLSWAIQALPTNDPQYSEEGKRYAYPMPDGEKQWREYRVIDGKGYMVRIPRKSEEDQ